MMNESLGKLVEAARKGDHLAWNGIVMRLQRRVFAAVLAVSGNMDEADEATQEAFIKLFDRIGDIENPDAVGGWLVRTAVNIARDHRRWRRLREWFGVGSTDAQMEPTSDPSPEVAVARQEAQSTIALWSRAKLSEKERLVLELRAGEEMTMEEIGRELDMGISTVKTHLTRARKKLRPLMKKI